MSDNKLTKDVYLQYAKKIVSVLYGDDFFNQYKKRVEEGYSDFKLVKKRLIQDISVDWISTIEDVLPNLDAIVRNPRRFIVQEEDIVDISLAKAISTESVKHLAQHTNMISKVDEDGTVTPNRILNITKEESFEIYENRFIFTLLLKLKDFVQMRYDKIKKASATQDVLQLNVDSKFNLPSKKVTYRTEYMAQLSFDEIMRMDPETLEKIERVAKIDRIITDFLSSSFAKSMRNSAPVRPPITRTNVILKEPNFKKALTLWQFIETYQATGGFSTSDDIEDYKIEDESQQELRQMVTLNTMLFESLYDQHETDMDLDDAQFTDLLRVGDLDFGKDEIQHDEYSQKLDEEDKTEDSDKQEEVSQTESEEQKEQEQETPPEEVEVEKEVIEEQEVEVDKDVEVEAPPKEEPDDEEPDADQFDQNLFDVRKLYKRPEDDKLRQEEVAKIKDAIDRCLVAYRKIKQEELDERDREENAKRRKEELEKRAEAFRARKADLGYADGQVYLGTDAFGESAVVSKNEEFKKAHKELFANRNERLDLGDKDLENIRKSIEAMEQERAKDEERRNRIAFAGDNEERETDESEIPVVDLDAQLKAKEELDRKNAVRLQGERNLLSGGGNTEIGFVDKREKKEEKEIKPVKTTLKPTSSTVKRQRVILPVDENKVQVGDAPVGFGDGISGTFGEQKANLGDLTKVDKPVRKRKKAEETPVETPAETLVVAETPATEETSVKPKIRKSEPRDPWALSPTTLNQRYDVASGKVRNFEAVDENKVKVGKAPVKHADAGDLLDDTFEDQRANLGNFEKKADKPVEESVTPPVEEKKTEEKKPAKKRTRKPKETQEVKTETPVETVAETPVETPAETAVKPKIRKSEPRDPWALSPTTLNQRYDVASGKVRNFDPVDENKVKVGKAPVKNADAGDLLDDTFEDQKANLGIKKKKPQDEE